MSSKLQRMAFSMLTRIREIFVFRMERLFISTWE